MQAVAILRELHPLTGHGRYVFPSLRTGERPMSDNTVNAALRRMGFTSDEMSAHGFLAMARTLMVELLPGIDPEAIEAQLAHGKSGPLGAAYDRADYLEQRRKMMREWAIYLDRLRRGADVVKLRPAIPRKRAAV
ncbi:hypothetical protein GCM10028796_01760 [Ramlibacter monticola]